MKTVKKEIELMRYVRSSILKLIEDLTLEQLNKVPEKFNNNIAWNLAHMIVTQQVMSYKLGGYAITVNEEWFGAYIPGTIPQGNCTAEEIAMIKDALKTTIDQFEQDIENNRFDNYIPWAIPSGMEVNSVEDAVKISCVHEGRHYGVITALVKLVG